MYPDTYVLVVLNLVYLFWCWSTGPRAHYYSCTNLVDRTKFSYYPGTGFSTKCTVDCVRVVHTQLYLQY
jgi:hypothetical protein